LDEVKQPELDKIDVKILYNLFIDKKSSPLQSVTLGEIIKTTKIELNYSTFFRRIQTKLIPSGYLKLGYKDKKAKTYYLSKEGVDYVQKNIIDVEENIYIEVEIDENEEDNNYE
jgi:hypothetical protein